MAGWDIDEEENLDKVGSFDEKDGFEDYMIVLHYPGLRAMHFLPQHPVFDSQGQPVMNAFNKSTPKMEDGNQESVYSKKTVAWKTKGDVLNSLSSEQKSVCNSIKALLNKGEVGVFYHSANRDDCAKYPGQHLHLLWHSPLTGKGQPQALWQRTQYKTLVKKCQENGGYCRSQGVKYLDKAIMHFITPPRVNMGTNYKGYFLLLQALRKKPLPDAVKLSEVLEEEDLSVSTDLPSCDFTGFEDTAQPSTSKKRSASGFDETEVEFVVQPPTKQPFVVKETETDRLRGQLRMLCNRWNSYTPKAMWGAVAQLSDDGPEDTYKVLWYKLSGRPKTKACISNIADEMQSKYQYMPFAQLINEYCEQVVESYVEHERPAASYTMFCNWVKHQGWNLKELITEITAVMDRQKNKFNSIAMIGATNSGKTTMFAQPLVALSRFCGKMGNRSGTGEFMYMELINKRVICIEECIMNPQALEDMKLLCGGEELQTNVKKEGYEKIKRTPVIITGNKEMWCLDASHAAAFQSRMYHRQSIYCEELKDFKHPSPKMWWYLMQVPLHPKDVPDVNDLISHPSLEDPITVDDLN